MPIEEKIQKTNETGLFRDLKSIINKTKKSHDSFRQSDNEKKKSKIESTFDHERNSSIELWIQFEIINIFVCRPKIAHAEFPPIAVQIQLNSLLLSRNSLLLEIFKCTFTRALEALPFSAEIELEIHVEQNFSLFFQATFCVSVIPRKFISCFQRKELLKNHNERDVIFLATS